MTEACVEATVYCGKNMLHKVVQVPFVTLLTAVLPLCSDSRVQNSKNNRAQKSKYSPTEDLYNMNFMLCALKYNPTLKPRKLFRLRLI